VGTACVGPSQSAWASPSPTRSWVAGAATADEESATSAPTRNTPPVADRYTPVIASVLGPPTFPFKGTDGKYHVSYDLNLQNASAVPATLQKLEVVDGTSPKRVLMSYDGAALVERLRTLDRQTGTVDDAVIGPERREDLLRRLHTRFPQGSAKNGATPPDAARRALSTGARTD
jgi:hypothetical protein